MELSNSAYARHRGVTEGAVRKALRQGRISQTANGKIDPTIADREWIENSDPAQVKLKSPVSESCSTEMPGLSYQKSRAIREAYSAKMTKLLYEKSVGKLISVEQVRKDAFNAGRITRDRLLNIPDRIIPKLVGKTDINSMKALLKEEIVAALSELHSLYGSRSSE